MSKDRDKNRAHQKRHYQKKRTLRICVFNGCHEPAGETVFCPKHRELNRKTRGNNYVPKAERAK